MSRRSAHPSQGGLQARPPQPQEAERAPHAVDLTSKVYLTAAETVVYLNLGSLSALYRLIREWQLPYGRVGRSYRFHRVALDRWVERRGAESLTVVRTA